MTRRELLAALASLPALAAAPGRAATGRPTFSDYPFSLGVASGDPDPRGFVLWTRLAPKPLTGGGMADEDVKVAWEVASDEGFTKIVARGETDAKRELAHAVHVEVEGLEPDHWYFYRFHAGSEVSPTARARTAPAAGAMSDKVRLAFASCQHYETGYYTAYEHMAAEPLDLIVHLGDYIYEKEGVDGRVRKHTGDEIMTVEDYRNRHALYRSDKLLQAAHHLCPWLVTWDDHEVDNNYSDRWSEELDVSPDEFLTRRAHAYQAYYEHMPLRLPAKPVGDKMQLYRRVPFGRLLDFQVLDTRQYRTDQPCGDKNGPECPDVFRADATILGPRQEKWLYQALEKSPALWNCMAQQVMVARVDREPGPDEAYSMDKWASYRPMLDRFLKFLGDSKPSNPIVLTGDIHSNWVCDLPSDLKREDSPTVATEFIGTSITSAGDGDQALDYAAAVEAENPTVKFFNRERGYVSCTVTPKEWRADYHTVEYVTKPGAPKKTRASFRVEAGKRGVERV
ncbi:MAG: alkaline phosphatase [Acidobacteria bacterium]|nr:alkaline phosphatase [Acidobacteriota bacterium]